MHNTMRKVVLLMAAAIILVFLIAAGIDGSGLQLKKLATRTIFSTIDQYLVLAILLSGWLFTIAMMCKALKKIPGVMPRQKDVKSRCR